MNDQPNNDVIIEIIQGVEGACVAINNRRVAGPKPWGKGTVIFRYRSTREQIEEALGVKPPAPLEPEPPGWLLSCGCSSDIQGNRTWCPKHQPKKP